MHILQRTALKKIISEHPIGPDSSDVCEGFYSRSISNSSLIKQTLHLVGTVNIASENDVSPGRRTKLLLGYPRTEDGTVLKVSDDTCPACGNLDPWSTSSTGAFYRRFVAGTPEYMRKVHARLIYYAALELKCMTCGIISTGLEAFSRVHYSTDNGWLDKEMKIIITGNGKTAALVVGPCKTERVEFFVLHDERSPWTAIGERNYIFSETLSSIDHIKKLVLSCSQQHPRCPQNNQVNLPTRVIDVGSPERKPHLCFTKGQKGSYLALSYCWGKSDIDSRTTQANVGQRMHELSLGSLCKTHRDAVEITLLMGVQFLWIDSICIIQDDPADWEVESSQMGSVYENALLTIAAAGASDSSGGCLLKRPEHTSTFENISILDVPGDELGNLQAATHLADIRFRKPVLSHNLWSNGFAKQAHSMELKEYSSLPLEDRAWCFQERILSTRIVHFTKEEFVLECNSAIRCECGTLNRIGANGYGALTARDDFHSLISCTDDRERTRMWMSLVIACTRRQITYQKDRLPSLSGIAKRLQRCGFGEYLGGLWRHNLPAQLFWTVDRIGVSRRAPSPRAPSWSWASIENSSFSFGFGDDDHTNMTTLAVVEDVKCTSSSKDPTGNLDRGYLKIKGPSASLTIRKAAGRRRKNIPFVAGLRGQIAFRLSRKEEDEMIGDFRPDFLVFDPELPEKEDTRTQGEARSENDVKCGDAPDLPKGEELNILLLAISQECSEKRSDSNNKTATRLSCLVLRPLDEDNGKEYERIGAVQFLEGEGWTEFFDLTQTREITIV